MIKTEKFSEIDGLRVSVDRVLHLPNARTPAERPNAFAYFITIQNDSPETVTIRGRKWVITNDAGEITAVEGEGVVGEFPRIEPGEHFRYNSYHVNNTATCWAEGSYLCTTDEGRPVIVRIPRFVMRLPPSA